MLGQDFPEICRKRNFRMTKKCLLELAPDIHAIISPEPHCPNYRYLTTEKKLAITNYGTEVPSR